MPFIRYLNGDRAVAGWGTCSCGRGLPLLRKVVGRRSDMIHTPDGRHISGVFFPHLVKEFPAIRQFQVVQDHRDHVQLRIVLGDACWRPADSDHLDYAVRKALGPEMHLDILPVDDIPLSSAGKHQVVVNRCGPNGSPAGAFRGNRPAAPEDRCTAANPPRER
jgi:phenylacetate-CoA ligase